MRDARYRFHVRSLVLVLVLAALVMPLTSMQLIRVNPGPGGATTPVTLTPEQKEILNHMSIVYLDDGEGNPCKTIRISGVNVQVVNGLGTTATTNCVGNLILGYNEIGNNNGDTRVGSHNLVVGTAQSHTSFGGLLGGSGNTVSGPWATASGGSMNVADGNNGAVCGGTNNQALGDLSTVTGGRTNTAFGGATTVHGGQLNSASGAFTSILGGYNNATSDLWTSIAGGQGNLTSANYAAVSGGNGNVAGHQDATVSGGCSISTSVACDHVP